ncbi:MAG: DUF1700 domain-containing protein [Clostridia bacterium]|nr:DUF1700 domain-containing protein [Clostridia bacterium]
MTKNEFLFELGQRLSGLPKQDIVASLDYYSELIDDHIENGMTEEEAINSLGSIDEIVAQILGDTPLKKIVKEKVRPKRPLRAWEIVLLILGSPVWVPLLLAALIVILAVYIVIWSIVVTFFAVDASLGAVSIAGIAASPFLFAAANPGLALMFIGAALVCAGLCILFFLASDRITRLIIWLSKKILLLIKSSFVGKENEK